MATNIKKTGQQQNRTQHDLLVSTVSQQPYARVIAQKAARKGTVSNLLPGAQIVRPTQPTALEKALLNL